MFSQTLSGATYGISARIVRVETHIQPAIFSFAIVGLPDSAVKESRNRVYAAIKTSGFRFPHTRITVNLAPADIRKEGSAYDLPIAIGILAATGVISSTLLDRYVILGELALDGLLRPIRGTLPVSVEAKKENLRGIIVPRENAREAAMFDWKSMPWIHLLRLSVFNGENTPETASCRFKDVFKPDLKFRLISLT
jgi:magnesium chelatase family protein